VRSSEWIAFVYFLYLAGICWLRPLPLSRRLFVTALSLALAAAICAIAATTPPLVRDWTPLVYVGIGYYATGWLFIAPSETLEAWLMAWDRKWLGDPTTRFAAWPRWLVTYLDVLYVFCFLLLPGGYAALAVTGHADLANRYWTMVLAADLGAFAPLSVFQTRPPWMLERAPVLRDRGAHRLASYMVRNATIRVNTFPSGHVAVSFAVAFAVMGALPATGVLLLMLAASIAVACVVGRYHYTMDVITGAALGAAVSGIVAIWGVS
jgi:membrane-associated phospholipid phosphatase